MTERVLGPTGSPRRRRTLLLPLIAVFALALLFVAGAQAVHDETFQLDGNTVAGPPTNLGGNTQSIDWNTLFDADGDTITPLPAGFDEATFDRDFTANGTSFVNSDSTTFATGSKDTLPISGWQCNFDNNVNNKIDVVNAYAASYTAPSGDEILYFGLERFTNTGTADVGFWFLQAPVACESSQGTATFSGAHTDGDLLVVSEFTGGGNVSTVNVYRWNGGANGSLGQIPVASGVDCRSPSTPTDDPACGAANTAPITTPWQTAAFTQSPKVGNTLPIAQFFEAGLNLTDSQLGGKCFNTFIADTRSSAELGATLFDFAGGELGACESGITSAQTWEPNDSATVTVTGASTWAGNVAFTLYEGLTCSGTSKYTQTVGVNQGSATASTTNSTFQATATQNYSWGVVFTPDAATALAGVLPASHCETSELKITN